MSNVSDKRLNSLLFTTVWFNLEIGLGTDHLTSRGYSDSQCYWKKYSDFGGGKKKSDSEFLSYNLMLNSGKKFALCATKKIKILTLVLSEKNILNETKNHYPPPPCKLNGRSLTVKCRKKLPYVLFYFIIRITLLIQPLQKYLHLSARFLIKTRHGW